MSHLGDEALRLYKKYLWSIIPIKPDKTPYVKWEEYQKRLPSDAEIVGWWERWPKANIGLVTGKISETVVLDLDKDDGYKTIEDFSVNEPFPETLQSITGGGGRHYFFKHPGLEVRNFTKKIPGLDFRGDGGYVILPPSVHLSGNFYEWDKEHLDPPAIMPRWLLKLCTKQQDHILPSNTPGRSYVPRVNPTEALQGVGEGQRDTEIFKYASSLRARRIAKEEAEVLVLQMAAACSPPFPQKEALAKLEQAWKYPEGSADSPQAQTENAAIYFADPGLTLEKIFSAEGINYLAHLKKFESANFSLVKSNLKKKIGKELNLNDLEKAVNARLRDLQGLRLVDESEPAPLLETILKDIPLKGLKIPYKWNINEGGIWCETKNGPVRACAVPVILSKRLTNHEKGESKTELQFYRDKKWNRIIANNSTIYDNRGIVQLSNKDLPVSSSSAKNLVSYLEDFQAANLDTIPQYRSTSHLGWCNGLNFIPGAEGEIVIDTDEALNVSNYHTSGSLNDWIEIMNRVREYPLSRFMLSASFAAPLLKVLGQRVYIIHIWGQSRGGKTAALKAALSVWGEPDELIASFNATKVGLERLAGFYCDLPLGLDERQVVGDKQGFIESLVYLLGLGKGKARGAKKGGLQEFQYWRTIVLTTGEEPLSGSSSTAGIKTRSLELYGIPIENESLAGELHNVLRFNYGHAGIVYIQKLIETLRTDQKSVTEGYDVIYKHLQKKWPDRITSHLSAIATVVTADFLSSQWVFGVAEEQSFDEALELAETIIQKLETISEIDDAERAYQYFMSWHYSQWDKFQGDAHNPGPPGERFGFLLQGVIYVFPNVFERMMKEGGFNTNRVLKDWAANGWILTDTWGAEQKRRLKVKRKDPKTQEYMYVVGVTKRERKEDEE